jgi:hypothetical protein
MIMEVRKEQDMEWHNLLVEGYRRVQESMEHVLTGLSQDVLDWQPKDGNNTIGWLAWHLTRQQDAQIASLMSKDQLWIRGKWYKKFKRSADPKDSGFGHTKEQVKTFKSPDINTLI